MENQFTLEAERDYYLKAIDFALLYISDLKEKDKVAFRERIADELLREDSMLWHDSPYSIIAGSCLPFEKSKDVRGMAWLNLLNETGAILYREMEEEYGVLKPDIDVASIKSQIAALFSNDITIQPK